MCLLLGLMKSPSVFAKVQTVDFGNFDQKIEVSQNLRVYTNQKASQKRTYSSLRLIGIGNISWRKRHRLWLAMGKMHATTKNYTSIYHIMLLYDLSRLFRNSVFQIQSIGINSAKGATNLSMRTIWLNGWVLNRLFDGMKRKWWKKVIIFICWQINSNWFDIVRRS